MISRTGLSAINIYIAYSDGDIPGASAVCNPPNDSNCLELNIASNTFDTASEGDREDVRALVIMTSKELSGQSWTDGSISDYFESSENTNGDRRFSRKSYGRLTGTATSGSSNNVLVSSGTNFNSMGITAGYTIVNSTDGSYGKIQSVDSDTQITATSLAGGSGNVFSDGDSFEIYNNDRIRIATSCPSDTSKLCWSQ